MSGGSNPVVVIGDGWAALGMVGFLATSGLEICWIKGSEATMLAPLGCLELGPGIQIWQELAKRLEIKHLEIQEGSFIREFRNKAFRQPAWLKAPQLNLRTEVRDELLWAPERTFVGARDVRFNVTVNERVEELKAVLHSSRFSNLRRVEGIPVSSFQIENKEVRGVSLSSGENLETRNVIYADRWSLLNSLEGLPRPLTFLKKREPMGVLQASFTHSCAVGADVKESFYSTIYREQGEELEKHIWGHFSSSGYQSVWTICLSPEEGEDNHEIAKKLRRMKSTLDKIFPEAKFTSTILEEKVSLVENAVFSLGASPQEPIELSGAKGIVFMTDGYGPSCAFDQVGKALGVHIDTTLGPESENMNLLNPRFLQ